MDRLEILDFVESVINLIEHDMYDSHELIHNTKSNMKAQNTVSLLRL